MKRYLFGLAVLMFVNGIVNAAPTNDQLYKMLLEVKAEQEKLKKEATEAKKRESDLRKELNHTKAELLTAKKQLDESFVEKQDELKLEEGFFASAGGIYVRPLIDTDGAFEVNELDYEPGFQVSTGYQAADNWDYTLKYRHFSAKESTTSSEDFGLVLVDPNAPDNSLLNLFKSKYKMNYDVLDFEIGKQLSLSDSVTLRISGGLRYAALDERWHDSTRRPFLGDFTDKRENDFWGIGPRVTASPTWKPFGNNFRIFGNVGAAFLMGQYEIADTHSRSGFIGVASSRSGDNKEGFFTMAEAGGGIGYTLKGNLVDVDFQAGYQFEHWLDSDLTDEILFRGFHGAYGTIGVKF